MPNLLTRLIHAASAAPATKAAPVSGLGIAFYGEGRAVWTARDYGALAREGFQRNAVVHRAVRLVAEAAASLPLVLTDRPEPHPLTALLARPNPREGGSRLLESLYGHLLVCGNAALWSKCTKAVKLAYKRWRSEHDGLERQGSGIAGPLRNREAGLPRE